MSDTSATSATTTTAPPVGRTGEWSRMRGITPRAYICRRAPKPIDVNGRIDDPSWAVAPWTDDFVDIEGPHKPEPPRFRTRAKMLWDDGFFYVAAEMDEPHVVATLIERNSVIYNDNDFEIFIDPDGDNHNYYEFEINAHGTIWELTLPKPYKDGGDPQLGTNLPGLKSAVSLRGTLNDSRDVDEGWSVEVAIPWKALAAYNRGRATPPRAGDVWRVNFSRVEWKYDVVDGKYVRHARDRCPEDNWVWSPTGVVDMHRPERWGFVWLAGDHDENTEAKPDPSLAARDALMETYYRQRVFRGQHGRWARSLSELGFENACIQLQGGGDVGFVASASIPLNDGRVRILHIEPDSRMWFDDDDGDEEKR